MNFQKGLARDDKMYQPFKCGDSLYDHKKHLNLVMKKDEGILQFAHIGKKRGDDEKREAKLKEYTKEDHNMMQELYKDDHDGQGIGKNKGENWMRGIDYRNTSLHYNRGVTYNKQFARINPKTSNYPVHMQQLNNRLACG